MLAFGLSIWVASLPSMHRADQAATLWLQRGAPAPDIPASMLVLLGNAEYVISAVTLVAVVLLLRGRRAGADAVWLAAGLTAASLLAVALKTVIVHPGPTAPFQRPANFFGRLGIQGVTPYSFPSGHTTRATLLALTALRNTPWLAATLIMAMMAALVYLGAHWLSDVLGGLCLGWALADAGALVRRARSRNCPPD